MDIYLCKLHELFVRTRYSTSSVKTKVIDKLSNYTMVHLFLNIDGCDKGLKSRWNCP